LARAAGGWQRCEEIIFADSNDPDFQQLLTALTTVQRNLTESPRADLLSVDEAVLDPR
jgi:hypothetical protein